MTRLTKWSAELQHYEGVFTPDAPTYRALWQAVLDKLGAYEDTATDPAWFADLVNWSDEVWTKTCHDCAKAIDGTCPWPVSWGESIRYNCPGFIAGPKGGDSTG